MGLLAVIGYIIVFIVVIAVLCNLGRHYSWLRWALPLVIAIGTFILWGIWWISLIFFFFLFGLYLSFTETKTRRGNSVHCGKCGCDTIRITEETDDYLVYKCPKCGNTGSYNLYR